MARKTAGLSGSGSGLSESDITDLRRDLEAGKRPRVFATVASGIEAGTSGQVVAIGDPAEREFVVVRISGDELPFAPEDLNRTRAGATAPARATRPRTTPRRAPAAQRGRADAPVDRGSAAGLPLRTQATPAPAKSTQATPAPAKSTQATPAPARSAPAAPAPAKSAPAAPAPAKSTQATPAAKASAPVQPPQTKTAAQPAQPKGPRPKRGQRGPASLAVTVRYADGRWTVEAGRGAKTVVKATPVRAGHALHLIEQLRIPAVTDLVTEAVTAGRADAERRASELREQLAAAEAELADYERRPAT